MCEMLGNYYFLNGYYSEAINEYEKENNNHLMVLIKLIFCCLMTKQHNNALIYTYRLLCEDEFEFWKIKSVINDHPFYELKYELINNQSINNDENKLKLAIINLFDEIDKSLEYLKDINDFNKKYIILIINKIQQIIREKRNGNKKNRQEGIYS